MIIPENKISEFLIQMSRAPIIICSIGTALMFASLVHKPKDEVLTSLENYLKEQEEKPTDQPQVITIVRVALGQVPVSEVRDLSFIKVDEPVLTETITDCQIIREELTESNENHIDNLNINEA